MGGISGPNSLPGKGHYDFSLFLPHWATFKEPGKYTVTCRRKLELAPAGVDVALVSLSAPNVYWGSKAISAKAARDINDEFAAAQQQYAGRIRWMASLPWTDPTDAVAELRRAKQKGAVGVCMLTDILGTPLTDAAVTHLAQLKKLRELVVTSPAEKTDRFAQSKVVSELLQSRPVCTIPHDQ